MESLSSYIPTDRLHALVNGLVLPDRCDGAVLFADIAGFTALTEALLKRCKLSTSAVKTHQQINVVKTRCPGTYFPTRSFIKGLGSPR